MEQTRCPKCGRRIAYDETKYPGGRLLVFTCPGCGKEFRARTGAGTSPGAGHEAEACGSITVIENRFHQRQILPLTLGDNRIGRSQKGSTINTPIETSDPSMDTSHCIINVSRGKDGKLMYVLRDWASNTGTFVDNELLGNREKRVIHDGTLFTIGATSIILHSPSEETPHE